MNKVPVYVKVPIKLADESTGEELLPVHLPFDIFYFLFNECNFHVEHKLIKNFWEHLENVGDTWACSTSRFRAIHGGQVWPLGFYGDDAVMAIQNNPLNRILGLTVNCPLFRPRSTRLSKYTLFSIETDKIVSYHETIYPVLEEIVRSFNKLTEEGINGNRFLVGEIRGDQVFIKALFRHTSWWKATKVCFRCRATAGPGPLNYCLYESNNGWTQTLRTTDQFVLEELPDQNVCDGVLLWSYVNVLYFYWGSIGFMIMFWIICAHCQGPLIDLYFFNISLIKHCTLHIVNLSLLGISNGSVLHLILIATQVQFCLGSQPTSQHGNMWFCFVLDLSQILRGMLLDMGVFGDTAGGYVEPLGEAFKEFSAWRRSMKISCSQKRFSAKSLVRETTYGWFLNCKGFNARVVSEWLMCKLVEVNRLPEFQGLDPRSQLSESALKLGGVTEGLPLGGDIGGLFA